MTLAQITAAAGIAFRRALLSKTCTRLAAANAWASAGTFPCFYEEAPPEAGAPLDYEGGSGYGYQVFAPAGQAMAVTDRITVDGLTLEVIRLVPAGTADPLARYLCVRR